MSQKTINSKDLQDFDALFCKRDTVLSNAIQIATGSEVSHVCYVRWFGKKLRVLDTQINGFEPIDFEEWKKYGYTAFAIRMKGFDHEEMFKREIELIGKKYDFKGLLVKQPRKQVINFFNKFRKNKKDNWNEETDELKRVYCSEAFEYIFFGTNENSSPKDVLNKCCLTSGYEFIGNLEY